jgi:hypothetical protein
MVAYIYDIIVYIYDIAYIYNIYTIYMISLYIYDIIVYIYDIIVTVEELPKRGSSISG